MSLNALMKCCHEKEAMNTKKGDFGAFWGNLEVMLTESRSTSTVFNQYRDRNDQVDLPDAASIRVENLRLYMADATSTASILIVGEAAGPWGCRFSGVPFTGEKQILDPHFPVHGKHSSKTFPALPTKLSPPFISRSAEIFWGVLRPYHARFLVWDAFPLHSHKPHDFLTVRNPTKGEVSQFRGALSLIREYIEPTQIIAVGKKVFQELDSLNVPSIYVRHPSRGGKPKFTAGMKEIFGRGINKLELPQAASRL